MKIKSLFSSIFCFIFLFLFFTFKFNALDLKEVMKIGSDKPNYEFFLITSVDTDKQGNIYIADSKGCLIRKYSREGKFIAESGRKGNGPGEFMFPKNIFINNDNVFVSDFTLRQINVFDKKLRFTKSIKLFKRPYNFFVNKKKIYISTIQYEKKNTFFVFNMKGEKLKEFFSREPYFLTKIKKDKMFIAWKISYGAPTFTYKLNKRNIALVFSLYDNHSKLYLLDFNGNITKIIKFDLGIKYKTPWFLFNYPPKKPTRYNLVFIDSIYFYKNKYIILNYKRSDVERINNKEETKTSSVLVVLNTETGKIIEKKSISATIRILNIKGDYMYAKDFNDDIEKLHIYKIEGIK